MALQPFSPWSGGPAQRTHRRLSAQSARSRLRQEVSWFAAAHPRSRRSVALVQCSIGRVRSRHSAATGEAKSDEQSAQPSVVMPAVMLMIETIFQVLDLIAGEHTNLRPNPDMAAAVDALIASGNTPDPGPATFRLGQGVWEVFYAPHIRTLSGLMLAEFSPIRYTLDGKHLYSNVGYKLPLGLARGWLSASGSLTADSTDSLKLRFDRFWVDRDPEPLRDTISADEAASGWDGFVTKVGSLTFFDGLATFPVLYVDEDLTVFRFSPLGVNIAAQRVK